MHISGSLGGNFMDKELFWRSDHTFNLIFFNLFFLGDSWREYSSRGQFSRGFLSSADDLEPQLVAKGE